MSIDNKQFNNQIRDIGKEIYKEVEAFVEENKGSDKFLYRSAKLILGDGREMRVAFDPWGDEADISIRNHQWNEEAQRDEGDSFYIMSRSGYGFLVNVTLYYLDKEDLRFSASDKEYPYNDELTDEEKENILLYMVQLRDQMPTLVYDKERTHSVDNYTPAAKRNYNIRRYKEKLSKLEESNSENKYLPSVETAVNWWINQITGSKLGGWLGDDFTSVMNMVLAEQAAPKTSAKPAQVFAFKEALSKAIMEKLGNGYEPSLETDYGPSGMLVDAIMESKIRGVMFPMKTRMIVSVDSVRVKNGYGAKYEEIYAVGSKVEDEKKKAKQA